MILLAAATGLHWLDAAVLVAYLIGVTAVGLWISRKVKGLNDYFMPRRFSSSMMVMHAFGTGTASDQAVTVASATFKGGVSGIWYQWLWLFATPFYWFIAPIFRRFRAITTADVYELRFDRSVAILFSVVGMASMTVKIGLLLVGAAALIESGTAGLVDARIAVGVVTVLFVFYGVAGGLSAAIITDYAQGILTIIFSVMLLPCIWSEVGGMSGVRETIMDESMLSLVAPGKISTFFVIMMAIQALVGIVAQPHVMGVCSAGRSEWEGRVGFVGGNLIKRLCTIAWCLTGIAAVAWYLQRGISPSEMSPDALQQTADGVYGEVAHTFLPAISPGLLGLFLAALLAGVMSSCDSFMISSSALFTENVYRPWRPERSQRHYVWIGRFTSIAIVAGGVAFALWVPGVVDALEIWFKIAPMMGIVFWIALFWRRMTVAGAWATTLTGFAIWWLTTQSWFIVWLQSLPQAEALQLVWTEGESSEVYTPWQIVMYMSAASIVGIVVSLVTRPVDAERLNRFYSLSRTPIVPGEETGEPCTLPASVVPLQRPLLVDFAGVEVPRPSQRSVVGFAIIWLFVAMIVGGFIVFMR